MQRVLGPAMGICGSTSKVQSGSAGVYCVYGPPGSVKTQLCEVLSAEHEYGVITLGEAQRRAIRDNEELGPKVKEAIEEKVASDKEARKEGKPVEGGPAGSDDLNADILQWLISGDQSSAASGWLIDGFPMTKKQHSLLAKRGVHVKKAVVVSVDDEVLVKLATSRRMDLETKTLYHLEGWGGNAKPPDDAQVQARLTTRADDSEDKARERIQGNKRVRAVVQRTVHADDRPQSPAMRSCVSKPCVICRLQGYLRRGGQALQNDA